MQRLRYLILCLACCCVGGLMAQGSWYGIKGGSTIGTQQWNSFDRAPLLSYHGILSVESASSEDFGLFAQLGYHLKGSTIRRRLFGTAFNANLLSVPAQRFEFQNLSLTIGAKQYIKKRGESRIYYLFGVRADYTLGTNLDEYERFTQANGFAAGIYPFNIYFAENQIFGIRRINYGITGGGGMNIPFSEYVEGILEFTVNPDFSLQYQQPSIPNVINPFNGQTRTLPERRIRNLTFELTMGVRFLRKVEYID